MIFGGLGELLEDMCWSNGCKSLDLEGSVREANDTCLIAQHVLAISHQ